MQERAASYDVVVFVTYLYYTAWAGMKAVAGRAPILFHPTAHDEPPLALNLFVSAALSLVCNALTRTRADATAAADYG